MSSSYHVLASPASCTTRAHCLSWKHLGLTPFQRQFEVPEPTPGPHFHNVATNNHRFPCIRSHTVGFRGRRYACPRAPNFEPTVPATVQWSHPSNSKTTLTPCALWRIGCSSTSMPRRMWCRTPGSWPSSIHRVASTRRNRSAVGYGRSPAVSCAARRAGTGVASVANWRVHGRKRSGVPTSCRAPRNGPQRCGT